MMTSALFVFYLSVLFTGGIPQSTEEKLSLSAHQVRRFILANVGESLTLPCLYNKSGVTRLYWYKQTLGHRPRPICTVFGFNDNGSFHDEFKNNPRFSIDTKSGINHLKITDLQISDSATYFCAGKLAVITEFAEGITVNVKGSGWKKGASVNQSVFDIIQPGGSSTLSCTVHTGTCDGGHSVYWFRDSEESHPGLIYTHGHRNDTCKRKPDTQTHTCVYKLPMTNLNRSHTGTYYCAVALCGHILFGNGTKMDNEDKEASHVLVFLSGALAFTIILVVVLVSIIYKINKANNLISEPQARSSSRSRTGAEGYQDADNLHYAALNVNLPKRSHRQRDKTMTECVYSGVKK